MSKLCYISGVACYSYDKINKISENCLSFSAILSRFETIEIKNNFVLNSNILNSICLWLRSFPFKDKTMLIWSSDFGTAILKK
jgi:hypothetical protein